MRGRVTKSVTAKAEQLLGIKDISTTELRFMPYVQYVMMNEQKIDPRRVNLEERKILARWRQKGWIEGGAAGLMVSKEFWDAIHEILWISYVVQSER